MVVVELAPDLLRALLETCIYSILLPVLGSVFLFNQKQPKVALSIGCTGLCPPLVSALGFRSADGNAEVWEQSASQGRVAQRGVSPCGSWSCHLNPSSQGLESGSGRL